jgi:hypothetical protein
MRVTQFPFPLIWIGSDLGHHRPRESTYSRIDHDTLPRLPLFLLDGSFDWLRREPSPMTFDNRFAAWAEPGIPSWKEGIANALGTLASEAANCTVTIPESFYSFLRDDDLVTRVRSPTDCEFLAPDKVIRNRGPAGGHFVHFMSDSQNCYEWCLYIDSKSRHCVVASFENLADPALPAPFWENLRDEIVVCEATFESFILRLWMENEIWFRLVERDQPLTQEMTEYLNHYRA